MGRKTIEEQDVLRNIFLANLDKYEKERLMRVQFFIKGKNKQEFINDLRNKEISISGLCNEILDEHYSRSQGKQQIIKNIENILGFETFIMIKPLIKLLID